MFAILIYKISILLGEESRKLMNRGNSLLLLYVGVNVEICTKEKFTELDKRAYRNMKRQYKINSRETILKTPQMTNNPRKDE